MNAANFAPVYCALYPQLTEIARKHGYAMAVHGSVARDFDIICIPWIEAPSLPEAVVEEIIQTFSIKKVGEPDTVCHGRKRFTLALAFGECFFDLQFMPKAGSNPLSGPLADALLKMHSQLSRLNATIPAGWTPFLVDEVNAVNNLLQPENIIHRNQVIEYQAAVYQCRTRPANPKRRSAENDGWCMWEDCSEMSYNHIKQFSVKNDVEYQVRKLFVQNEATGNV